MMMMGNRNAAEKVAKWVIGLLLLMMGARLLIFVLAAAGLINWGGFTGTSWLWIMPVLMVLMMGLMFFVMPRLMHHAPGPGSEETPSRYCRKGSPGKS